jgi:hypothetical protein
MVRGLAFGILLASTVLLGLSVSLMLRPGYYLNSGNLHDIFLPLNSALSSVQGLVLHRDFHTPFGWVYSLLNRAAWRVVTQPGTALSINDLIVVASLIWAVVVSVIYGIFLALVPRQVRFPFVRAWLIGLFLFVVAFNFRGLSGFSLQDVTWYGTYNAHLWALLFLQMIGVFVFVRHPPALGVLLWAVPLQAACVMVSLNYKVSFGLAAAVLAAAPLFTGWRGGRWRVGYVLGGLAALALGGLLLTPGGYDYSRYLQDLSMALSAKSEARSSLVWDLTLASIAVACVIGVFNGVAQSRVQGSGWASGQGWVMWAQLAFGACVVVAVNLAIAGDFSRPHYYLFASLALYVLTTTLRSDGSSSRSDWVVAGASVVLFLGVGINLGSDMRVGHYKSGSALSKRYERVSLSTPWGDLDWAIQRYSVYQQLTGLFELNRHPNKVSVLASMAFRAVPTRDMVSMPFLNGDYVDAITSAQHALKGRVDPAKTSVLMLDFANPMPMLLGTPVPRGSIHWIHFGTSLPLFKRDEVLYRMFDAADVVVLPVTSIDGNSQMLLNCKFHKWNESRGYPLVPFAADDFQFYYSRKSMGAVLKELMAPEIGTRCDILLQRFRDRDISPT